MITTNNRQSKQILPLQQTGSPEWIIPKLFKIVELDPIYENPCYFSYFRYCFRFIKTLPNFLQLLFYLLYLSSKLLHNLLYFSLLVLKHLILIIKPIPSILSFRIQTQLIHLSFTSSSFYLSSEVPSTQHTFSNHLFLSIYPPFSYFNHFLHLNSNTHQKTDSDPLLMVSDFTSYTLNWYHRNQIKHFFFFVKTKFSKLIYGAGWIHHQNSIKM